MQQLLDGSWAPLAFFSKKLSVAEQKYFALDRELLAAYSSLRHFCFLLEGRVFAIFTNHKPLTLALFRVSLPWSARQQCHLAFLAEFTSSIMHMPGIKNVVADTLSNLLLFQNLFLHLFLALQHPLWFLCLLPQCLSLFSLTQLCPSTISAVSPPFS